MKCGDLLLLDVGLWDLLFLYIFECARPIQGIEDCELYLNDEMVEKPIYEAE